MARELTFKVKADLTEMRRDIQKLMKNKFKIGVSGGGDSGGGESKSSKKTGGLLGTIAKRLLPLALLTSIKFIMDLIKLVINLAALGIIKLVQGIAELSKLVWQGLKNVWTTIVAWLKVGWEFIKNLPKKIWEFLKSLPGRIWDFLKALPGKIWDFLKDGFNATVDKLKKVVNFVKNLWTLAKERLKGIFIKTQK